MSGSPSPRRTLLAALVAVAAVLLSVLATLQTATAATGSPSAADARLTNFPGGLAVRPSSNVSVKLAQVPADYRRAVRAWLDAEATEECPNTPYLSVRSYHRDGFASTSQGWFAASGEPESCNGGGYAAIWSKRGGAWREVVAGQEAPSCRVLSYHHVPRSMVDTCYDYRGKAVDY